MSVRFENANLKLLVGCLCYWIIGCDLFMDFTGGLVQPVDGHDMYNFVCAIASPEGHVLPITILEAVVSNMTTNMIKAVCSDFRHRYEELMHTSIGNTKDPTYLHVDMFKGFIPALSAVFNETGGMEYLQTLFKYMLHPTAEVPFPCLIVWCYSHLMCGIAKRNPQFDKDSDEQVKADHKQEYKVTMMQLIRNIKCSTSAAEIESNINTMKLILECEKWDFNVPKQRFQYITLMDLSPVADDSKEEDEYVCCFCSFFAFSTSVVQ